MIAYLLRMLEALAGDNGGHPAPGREKTEVAGSQAESPALSSLDHGESVGMALAGFALARETVACDQPLAAYAPKRRDQGTSSWPG
jgi:hypothetical protein